MLKECVYDLGSKSTIETIIDPTEEKENDLACEPCRELSPLSEGERGSGQPCSMQKQSYSNILCNLIVSSSLFCLTALVSHNRFGALNRHPLVTPMLLNALDSTRYYVGSYLRDTRLRLSKGRHTTLDHGRCLRPIRNDAQSTTIIGHDACVGQ